MTKSQSGDEGHVEETTPQADAPALPGDSAGSAAAYAVWAELVERIRSGETDGMEELYQLFSKGIRFYLCRQLGPQEAR
ncbi:MAG: hypothetical protein ABSB35_13955 [Bryobacteraceae bacterium]